MPAAERWEGLGRPLPLGLCPGNHAWIPPPRSASIEHEVCDLMRHSTRQTVGALAASIVLSLLTVLPVSATSPITVTVNQFLGSATTPYVSEGVSMNWAIA